MTTPLFPKNKRRIKIETGSESKTCLIYKRISEGK